MIQSYKDISKCLHVSCVSRSQDELSSAHAEDERTLKDTMRKSHISNSLFMLSTFFFFYEKLFEGIGC